MTHIMLDLETWGKKPGCDLRSIGATVFDPATGHIAGHSHDDGREGGTFYLATDNPSTPPAGNINFRHYSRATDRWHKYPLHRDPETVQWWNDQSTEAQAAFANPVELRRALIRFDNWLNHVTQHVRYTVDALVSDGEPLPLAKWDGLRIYAHGPQFDISILAAAYEACGLPVPWHYRAPRDTRTVFDLAGIDDHSAWLAEHPGPMGIAHHALDDAICQARAVCAAVERMRRDGERYRWLRDDNAYAPEEEHIRGGQELDRLCDMREDYRR